MRPMVYKIKELSVATLPDFEVLAAKQGGCWCIYYQRAKPRGRPSSTEEWKRVNQRDKRRLIRQGKSHAVLVYDGETPVGWCQYGPREELPRIDARRFYRKLNLDHGDEKLWRITCFFVDRKHRGKGIAKLALRAALESIRRQGGGVVEAYPVVSERMSAVPEWTWFGTPGMFKREGFKEVAPLGTSGLLMRKTIRPDR